MGKIQTKHFSLKDSTVQTLALLTTQKDTTQQKDECCFTKCLSDFEFCLPFFPPAFPVKKSPFLISKIKSSNTENKVQVQTKCVPYSKLNKASRVLYHEYIMKKILAFLSYQDHQIISISYKRFRYQVQTFYLQREHCWDIINLRLQPFQTTQDYLKYSSVDEQSEHSLDLDRSTAFLQYESDNGEQKAEQQSKLDRVLTALSFSIGYFQGLNSIAATILAFYTEQRAYWVTRYLIARSGNMANDTKKYQIFMEALDTEVHQKLPQVYNHLQLNGLNIEYFAMRWVLALFSYDLQKQQLMSLWSLICTNGVQILSCFIICLLQFLQPKILQLRTDNLNNLLKHNLKQSKLILRMSFSKIIHRTKQQFIAKKFKPCNLKLKEVSQYVSTKQLIEIH